MPLKLLTLGLYISFLFTGVILLQPYQLFFQLEIWSTNDETGDGIGTGYEPYGHIYLKIGSLDVNQDIDMWNVDQANYLEVVNGDSYFVDRTLSFTEFDNFDQIGNITAHGQVWEYDPTNADDNVGKPNGDLFEAKDILNNDITRLYDGTGEAHIKIKMKLTKLEVP